MYDFQKCTMFLQKWISNLQDLPQNQNLETVPVCIVWQYYPHDNTVCIHKYDEYMKSIDSGVCHRLCSTGSSRLSPSRFQAHSGTNTFPSVCGLTATSFTDPSASRNTFSVSTITDGNARARAAAHFPPLRGLDCTLSRLRAEEYDRPVTQSIATPEPSSRTIPTLDRTLVARIECVATPGSRRLCPG